MFDVRDFATPPAALDAVTGEGGHVHFPAGLYEITESLRPKPGTRLTGDGPATVITCPSTGWHLDTTENFGLVNIYKAPGVTVANMCLRGTKSADQTHTPKLVFSEDAYDIRLEGLFMEHTAFEGYWQGGGQTPNRRIHVVGCTFDDVGFPAGGYVGLPAIQMHAEDFVVANNILTNVGTGIGASGARGTVCGNRVLNPTVAGIGLGDGSDALNISVTGNSIELTSHETVLRSGIKIGDGAADNGFNQVSANTIRIVGDPAHNPARGILSSDVPSISLVMNVIEIVGRGFGINVYGSAAGMFAAIAGNNILVRDETGACVGVLGIPNGAGKFLTALNRGNSVIGATRANGSFAYDFNANSGGSLDARMMDDWCDGGNVRLGSEYFGSGEWDGLPIRLPA